jgi:hypothetical protein
MTHSAELPPEAPEELMVLGARLILTKLLDILGPDWTSSGMRLWAERELEKLNG